MSSPNPVTDNPDRHRYELVEHGLTAFAEYQRSGDVVLIPHVETPPAARGGGMAARLMEGVAQHLRDDGLRAVPTCSYAAAWFRRRPDYADVLA